MLLVSDFADFDYARIAIRSGCRGYLVKPVIRELYPQRKEKKAPAVMECSAVAFCCEFIFAVPFSDIQSAKDLCSCETILQIGWK